MGIKHARVVVSGDKGQHEDWNADHNIDDDVACNKHQHLEHVIENRTDWPAGPVQGQIIVRTDEGALYIWDGSAWTPVTGIGVRIWGLL